jgi:hypothetical protein
MERFPNLLGAYQLIDRDAKGFSQFPQCADSGDSGRVALDLRDGADADRGRSAQSEQGHLLTVSGFSQTGAYGFFFGHWVSIK